MAIVDLAAIIAAIIVLGLVAFMFYSQRTKPNQPDAATQPQARCSHCGTVEFDVVELPNDKGFRCQCRKCSNCTQVFDMKHDAVLAWQAQEGLEQRLVNHHL